MFNGSPRSRPCPTRSPTSTRPRAGDPFVPAPSVQSPSPPGGILKGGSYHLNYIISICVYVYIYIYIHMCAYIYIYIYI